MLLLYPHTKSLLFHFETMHYLHTDTNSTCWRNSFNIWLQQILQTYMVITYHGSFSMFSMTFFKFPLKITEHFAILKLVKHSCVYPVTTFIVSQQLLCIRQVTSAAVYSTSYLVYFCGTFVCSLVILLPPSSFDCITGVSVVCFIL
jgi:hypothetical protein